MFKKFNFKSSGTFLVFLCIFIISGVAFSQSYYAERLNALEKPLGSDAQAGLYSQNFKVSQKFIDKGVKFLKAHDSDKAEIEFNKAVSMSEFAYAGYAYLGIVEMERKNYDKAIDYHKKAMNTFRRYKKNMIARKREFIKDLDTKVVAMEKNLDAHALNYEGHGASDMSLATSFKFQTIREKNPGYHEAKLNELKNYTTNLKKELLQDLRLSYPAFLFLQYGNCQQAQGNLNEAIVAYKNALTVKPNFGLAYSNLASCFVMAGELDLAKQYYLDAKKLNAPVHPAVEKAVLKLN